MSKTYVISDLHGRFDLLIEALKKIEEQAPHSGTHTIVTTGDYIDRGFESYDVIRTLMRYHSNRFGMINLMGNHETFMVDASKYGTGADFWCQYNGGMATMLSYGARDVNPSLIPMDHVAWVEQLPLFYEDRHRVYVHAGVPYQSRDMKYQPKQEVIWMRYPEGGEDDYHYRGKTIVHGHENYEDGPKEWPGRVDLDTNAWRTGRLVVGVFDDDKPGGLESTITIQGPTYKEQLADWKAKNAGY